MSCNAIIAFGKNAGKVCCRVDCGIRGHDKYTEGPGKCRSIIPSGRNKGLVCGRTECKFHHNIADFLELPEYFRSIVSGYRLTFNYHFYLDLVDSYKKLNNDTVTKEVFYDVVINTLNLFDHLPTLPRHVMFVYFCNLLDTPGANALVSSGRYKKFKTVYDQKLKEFYNEPYPQFVEYLKRTFQPGGKFFSIQKNLEYAREQARLEEGIRVAVIKDRYRVCFLFLCVLCLVVYFK